MVGVAVTMTLGSAPLMAGGFGLSEQSASGMGSAYASGGAAAEDASTMFFNPASMSLLKGRQIVAAGHLILPSVKYSDEGSNAYVGSTPVGALSGGEGDAGVPKFVPNFYFITPLSANSMAGIGINVPFGSSSAYDDDWIGRYHGVSSSMSMVNVNPAISFRVSEGISIGAGLNAQHVDVELASAIDFGSLCVASLGSVADCISAGMSGPQQDDGYAVVSGTSWGYGWNVGILFEEEGRRLSFAYRSEIHQDVDGTVDFTVPADARMVFGNGLFLDGDASASVTLPAMASASLYFPMSPRLALMADMTVTGWSSFDELRVVYANTDQPDTVTTHNWRDSWRVAVGGRYQWSDQLQLRLGAAYDSTPIPDAQHRTVRIPSDDYKWLTVGMRYEQNQSLWWDLGYGLIFSDKTKIDNTLETSATPHNVKGSFDSVYHIASAQVTWSF